MHSLSTPEKTYRVAQWAAGTVGRSALRAVIGHPNMELVGLHVHSASKEGLDAGELAGLQPIGVKASRDIKQIIAVKPDCVLYMQEGYNIDDMCQLLAAGINLVTTRSEFFFPKQMDPQHRERLESACTQGGSSLFATGSSPGFSTVVLPFAMLYMSRRLDCLTIDEYADIPPTCSVEMTTQVMGFGQPKPEQFPQQMLDHMAVGFAQSLAIVADKCGIELEGFESSGEVALANSPIPLGQGVTIETGTVAGLRITVAGMRNGKPVLRFRANWYCSRDLDQDWELMDNGWRVALEGGTPMKVEFSFPRNNEESLMDQMAGLTAHPTVNAIPYVCAAAPGIRTNADLPIIIPLNL
jgi:2,4-diaminopentanoate dehydrogenase